MNRVVKNWEATSSYDLRTAEAMHRAGRYLYVIFMCRLASDAATVLKVDFKKQDLIYPEDKGLIVNERQTCNFPANENFVVFECVHRLLSKGYKPDHIELEPKRPV